jgi:shikimate dehydrogenase
MTSRARRFHVIGDPIGHTLSPAMYRAAFEALGLPHTYEALRVSREELPAVLTRVRRGQIDGLTITVPHKVATLPLLDLHTDEVSATRAVNTVWVDATGRLVGANTDVEGLRADLLSEGAVPRRALVLGAGGASRACVVAITHLCAHIDVMARRPEQASLLVREVGIGRALPWGVPEGGEPYDLVLNATPAGMTGGGPGEEVAGLIGAVSVAPDAMAYDLVYRPPLGASATPFLARARERGLRAIPGRGMLVEQGVRALAIFLGTPISKHVRDAMRRAVDLALDADDAAAC